MKSWQRVLLILGIVVALGALYVGWRIYANTVGPSDSSFNKFLPSKILTFERREVTKRPNENNRGVETATGNEPVWLNAGYRAFYVTPGKLPFLRIHPERAPKESFEEDKKTIEREYQNFLSKNKDYVFEKKTYKNHEYYLVGNPDSGNGVRQSATIFFPEDSVLVTIYFFNQETDEQKWDYKDTKDFIDLRDKFINQYIDFALQPN